MVTVRLASQLASELHFLCSFFFFLDLLLFSLSAILAGSFMIANACGSDVVRYCIQRVGVETVPFVVDLCQSDSYPTPAGTCLKNGTVLSKAPFVYDTVAPSEFQQLNQTRANVIVSIDNAQETAGFIYVSTVNRDDLFTKYCGVPIANGTVSKSGHVKMSSHSPDFVSRDDPRFLTNVVPLHYAADVHVPLAGRQNASDSYFCWSSINQQALSIDWRSCSYSLNINLTFDMNCTEFVPLKEPVNELSPLTPIVPDFFGFLISFRLNAPASSASAASTEPDALIGVAAGLKNDEDMMKLCGAI